MALWRDTGAAGGVHNDRGFGKKCFYQEHIGYYADICAEADHRNASCIGLPGQIFPEFPASESRLIEDFLCIRTKLRNDLPSFRSSYAMFHREVAPFLGL